MKIAVLSDTRFPSRVDFPGHGLGRCAARVAEGLARRGHDVTFYALPDSFAQGCTLVYDNNEDLRAGELVKEGKNFDVYLDSTHRYELSRLSDFPVVSKVCDFEAHPVRNAVYNTPLWAAKHADPKGLVIYEGIDVRDYEFSANSRQDYLVWLGGNHNAYWKRVDVAITVSKALQRPIKLLGLRDLPIEGEQIICATNAEGLDIVRKAAAVIGWLPTYAFMEAAAMGTPSLGSYDHAGFIEDGVTGFICETPEVMVAAGKQFGHIDPDKARNWIRDNRNIEQQIDQFEIVLQRAANGEVW